MALLSFGEMLPVGGFVSSMCLFISSWKACASLSSFIFLARSSAPAMISYLGIFCGATAKLRPSSRTLSCVLVS